MRKILSITALTFREAIRSRMAVAVAVLLALVVVGFPEAMKGDGTEAGLAHTILYYTLGLSFALLSVAALCASSAAISSESRVRTLQLARVKPVAMWQFWLGKWIGLVAVFGLLLALAVAGVWPRVRGVADFAKACEKIPPELPSVREQVDRILAEAAKQGTDAATLRDLRRQALDQVPFATISLEPGKSWVWRFALGYALDAAQPIGLLFNIRDDSFSAPAQASCYLRDTDAPEGTPPLVFELSDFGGSEKRLFFPAGNFNGARMLELGIRHSGSEKSGPLMLRPRQDLFLLRPVCPLGENMLRAYLVMLPVLALVVALGLSLGAFFSLPVAVFCAASLLVSVFAADYAAGDPDVLDFSGEGNPGVMRVVNERIAVATTRFLQAVSSPALEPEPIARLSSAELVPADEIASSVIWNGLAIPAVLMVLSALALRRKELPE